MLHETSQTFIHFQLGIMFKFFQKLFKKREKTEKSTKKTSTIKSNNQIQLNTQYFRRDDPKRQGIRLSKTASSTLFKNTAVESKQKRKGKKFENLYLINFRLQKQKNQ